MGVWGGYEDFRGYDLKECTKLEVRMLVFYLFYVIL